MPVSIERVGTIDIGTVSVRVGVTDVQDGLPVFMARESVICDLGVGVDRTGRLDPEAIARVIAAVDSHIRFFAEKDCHAVSCQLTSAARDAQNVEELLGPLRERGLAPEVIAGNVEGALTFRGAAWDVPDVRVMVADLGGGSCEVACGIVRDNVPSIDWVHSFDLGARRLTDRFLSRNDPPTRDEVLECRAYSRITIEGFIPWMAEEVARPERLLVTGGTATSLVSMKMGMESYDPALVQGAVLTLDDVDEAAARLAAMPVAERAGIRGLQPRRAPVILGGTLLLGELMRATGFVEVTVSEFDGLIGSCLAVWGAEKGLPGPVGFTPQVTDPLAVWG